MGSANINDRSLLGDRDSELAVLVMDTDWAHEDIGSKDEPVTVTRKFARELRMKVWRKIFGAAANDLEDAIKRPVAQSSWEKIQARAKDNTKSYEAVFPHIPKNKAKIWPTIEVKDGKRISGLMPFDADFWSPKNSAVYVKSALAQLNGIKGHITLLPWAWTQGQDNKSGMHSALMVRNERSKNDDGLSATAEVAQTDVGSIDKDISHDT